MNIVVGSSIYQDFGHGLPKECMTVTEGKAIMTFPFHNTVFYNPVQEFNRDISICVIKTFAKSRALDGDNYGVSKKKEKKEKSQKLFADKKTAEAEIPSEFSRLLNMSEKPKDSVVVLEALAATGLRAIRYGLEIEEIYKVIANDMQPHAIKTILLNAHNNNISDKVIATRVEATSLLHHVRFPAKFRPDVVDLDPYGSASIFVDSAVQSVAEGGMLCVTCTDMACLCGNHPEAAFSKYSSVTFKCSFCHEMALRTLLHFIDCTANRYKRYIVPLLCISVDFYIRVFVKVCAGAEGVKNSFLKRSYVAHCNGCHSFYFHPIGRMSKEGGYGPCSAPVGQANCSLCQSSMTVGGPIWVDRIYQPEFVNKCIKEVSANKASYGTAARMEGILTVISEELLDSPLYYVIDDLFSIVKSHTPRSVEFRSALLRLGYNVSFTHCKKNAIKTSAPPSVVWDVVLACRAKNPTNTGNPKSSAGINLLLRQACLNIDFTPLPSIDPPSVVLGMSRFPLNPTSYWGPMKRGRVGVLGEKKQNERVDDAPHS